MWLLHNFTFNLLRFKDISLLFMLWLSACCKIWNLISCKKKFIWLFLWSLYETCRFLLTEYSIALLYCIFKDNFVVTYSAKIFMAQKKIWQKVKKNVFEKSVGFKFFTLLQCWEMWKKKTLSESLCVVWQIILRSTRLQVNCCVGKLCHILAYTTSIHIH